MNFLKQKINPIPSELDQQILDLYKQGEKLVVVETYKESIGIGLKESKDYVDKLAKVSGVISPKATNGCFIATACYGNYDTLEVLELRQFRDEKLLKTNLGKMFVSFYYFTSPPLAKVIAKSDLLKTLTKKYFLEPIVARLQEQTKAQKLYANSPYPNIIDLFYAPLAMEL